MVDYNLPIVAVLGATGVGKSKLAVEIAQRFNGEVISCDSMQVYDCLEIVTNQVTEQEKEGIAHYLIHCVAAEDGTFNAQTFQKLALKAVEEIQKKGKLVILAGGTTYYAEFLIFNNHLEDEEQFILPPSKVARLDESTDPSSERLSLHQQLEKVDPLMANKLHPNDDRKIKRALEIYKNTGIPYSQYVLEQQKKKDEDSANQDVGSSALRFTNVALIWLDSDLDVLNTRLDSRIDQMINRGMMEEMNSVWERLNLSSHYQENENKESLSEPEKSKTSVGVLQNIGFKEWLPYLIYSHDNKNKGKENYEKEVSELYSSCLSQMKIATRRYARHQRSWLRNRLLARTKLMHHLNEGSLSFSNPPLSESDARKGKDSTAERTIDMPLLYVIDATNVELSHWNINVKEKSINVVDHFLAYCDSLIYSSAKSNEAAITTAPSKAASSLPELLSTSTTITTTPATPASSTISSLSSPWSSLASAASPTITTTTTATTTPISRLLYLPYSIALERNNLLRETPTKKEQATLENWKKFHCEYCDRYLNGLHEWEEHNKGKRHRKRKSAVKKRKALAMNAQ